METNSSQYDNSQLTLIGSNGKAIILDLDPNTVNPDLRVIVNPDGNGGSNITLQQEGNLKLTYTGLPFTTKYSGALLPGNITETFVVSDVPANYTGIVEYDNGLPGTITSITVAAFGRSDTLSAPGNGQFFGELQIENGNVVNWSFLTERLLDISVNSSNGLLANYGPPGGYGDVAALYQVAPNSGENSVVGSWTSQEVACFHGGTRLLTQDGERPVEELMVGNLAATHSGGFARIKWIGHRSVDCRRHLQPADMWPVRVAAGAFGLSMPQRDLWLSPDHAVFAEGVLIPIKYLINGSTIVQEPRDAVTYWHIELERHDVILAEGLPCESYLDTGNRDAFANGGSATQLHPDFVREGGEAIWEATACAPLRIEGERVARVIARLRRRANKEAGHREASGSRRRRLPHRAAKCDLGRLLQPDWYLAENPDVAAVGMDAVQHYAGWGRAEGRLPCPEVELIRGLGLIDPGLVIFSMADVVAVGVDPIEHFCEGGWRERRRPNPYFDTGWYLDTHDVPAGMNPLLHYVLTGESVPPGRHFDPVWYRRRYALPCKVSPLAHYLAHRRTQRVSPLPSFDVAAYVRAHDDTLRPDRDAYAHYLAIGQFTTADTGQVDRAAA